MIVSMLESRKRMSDMTTLCDLCKIDSEDTPAKFWCGDCSQALCKPCDKVHRRLSATVSHKTLPITEAHASKKLRMLQHVDENCPQHDGKTVEVYCLDHCKLCCVVCFATKHRECKHISDIDAISKETEDSVVSRFIENLTDIKGIMDKIVTEKGKNLIKLDSENETIVREMENTVDKAKQHLDKLLSVFRDEVSRAHSQGRSSLLTSREEVMAFIKNVDSTQKLLQTVINSNSQRQKFITYEKLRSQILSHYENLQQNLTNYEEFSLVLQMDSVLQQCIHKMMSLGVLEIKQKPSATSRSALSSVSEILHTTQAPIIAPLSASVTLQKVVNISALGRARLCWLTGGTFLNNGNLLLVDKNKKSLIEFDESWTLVKEHTVCLDGDITTLSQTNKDTLLVVFGNEKKVCCYDMKSSLKLLYIISLQRSAWGVATCHDKVLVAGEDYVDILSQEGKVIESITSYSGLYVDVSVAASENLKTIYHQNGDTVVCRYLNGEEVFTYSNPKLIEPRGMALDSYDNLYVCGRGSGNLHQISAGGQRSRILIEKFHFIKHPDSVIVHPSKNIILIISYKEKTAFEVYRLN